MFHSTALTSKARHYENYKKWLKQAFILFVLLIITLKRSLLLQRVPENGTKTIFSLKMIKVNVNLRVCIIYTKCPENPRIHFRENLKNVNNLGNKVVYLQLKSIFRLVILVRNSSIVNNTQEIGPYFSQK